ncbi:hypothetical protein EW145_g2422 [Phellinidium pouzarii]|uniref:Major facilitator superfamily (MFS) profile domain-containing protein n=1 Tax=Phellinidium pouzarii TaxID=167371 RepID=A0A4S4LCH1_9AGAM|nr:hypothetical protein EW145_g2422 [Phellinidium pouzarii]
MLKTDDKKVKLDKPHIKVEEAEVPAPGNEFGETFEIDEWRLIRRVDWALLPWLSILLILCSLGRSGIGNARVPSNILIKKMRPSIWLSAIVLLWGIMMVRSLSKYSSFRRPNNLRDPSLSKVLSTITEAYLRCAGCLASLRQASFRERFTVYPGSITNASISWYRRNEIGLRFAILSSANQLSGVLGGLLAAAINNMDGIGGKPTWAWIFIIEGTATIIAAVAGFFLVQDFPNTARFLSPRERTFLIRRLQEDDQFSASGEVMHWKSVWKSFADWKTWMGVLLSMSLLIVTESFNSLIVSTEYHKSIRFFRHTCELAYSDRLRKRGCFSILLNVVAAIAYIILIFSRSVALSFFAVFIVAGGLFPLVTNTNAWISNNVEGSYKRGVTIALVLGFGNLQGIVSSVVYRARDKPWYTLGHGVMLAYIGVSFFSAVAFRMLLHAENLRRDHGERDEVITGEGRIRSVGDMKNGCYESVTAAKRAKGDDWSGYRYIL